MFNLLRAKGAAEGLFWAGKFYPAQSLKNAIVLDNPPVKKSSVTKWINTCRNNFRRAAVTAAEVNPDQPEITEDFLKNTAGQCYPNGQKIGREQLDKVKKYLEKYYEGGRKAANKAQQEEETGKARRSPKPKQK